MKKKIYLAALALATIGIAGCTNNKKTQLAHETDSTQVADMHTAETSLDYYGEYKGTIPAADCPGIKVTLILNKDNTYTLNNVYIDRKDADFNEEGTFSVKGNLLTLKEKNGNESYYKVEEGRVEMLNADKQPAEGKMKDLYVLKQERVF